MPAKGKGSTRHILVTGGAGFVGSNLVARLLDDPSTRVTILDNLSRRGVEYNLAWLESLAETGRLSFVRGDVSRSADVIEAAREASEIYHLAAQVAVTKSIDDPRRDFEVNTLGTMNVLEAARLSGKKPFIFFTSTNKVYGGLGSVPVQEHGQRYRADDPDFRGAAESTPLDFHSPYGCSKGAADQYVRDYARIYNLPTVVFRMSCIAGPRQFGNEDQGWVAHFLYSVLSGKSITIYGSGRQVRDILHVDDLVEAIIAARVQLHRTAGEVYNIGGGMQQSASVLEMLYLIGQLTGITPSLTYATVRPGDQPLYVSDISSFCKQTGWRPRRCLKATLSDIHSFWQTHSDLICSLTSIPTEFESNPQQDGELVEDEVA